MKSETRQLDCRIRPPQPEDFEKMAELAKQLGYPSTPQEIERRLSGMLDGKQHAVWVAELAGGQIAGWIGTYVFRSLALDPFIEINGLVVDKKVRSRGVGKLLLQAAEQWALSGGHQVISVRSNAKRRAAHRFYGKNGYEWTKTQKSFRKMVTGRANQSSDGAAEALAGQGSR